MPPTAFARTDFGSSPKHITLRSMTVGAGKVFALKAAAPQQGPDVRFHGDFGKKAFSWKRFVRHHTPLKRDDEAESPCYTTGNPCVHFADRHLISTLGSLPLKSTNPAYLPDIPSELYQ